MPTEIFQFDDFELDRNAFELRQADRVVRLERIPLELLFLLVERRGELVTRQEILERIWGKDIFVDADNAINTAVRKIRLRPAAAHSCDGVLHLCYAFGHDPIFGPPVKENGKEDIRQKLTKVVSPAGP
jgi:DNA-binding response OmpR family regulator